MSVKIRLSRVGKKNSPMYRIVVTDSKSKRDGKFLENVGAYNPINQTLIQFNEDRINYWVSKGAIESDTVKKLHRMHKDSSESTQVQK